MPPLVSTDPYFYNGIAQALTNALDGSVDTNGGIQHHFVTNTTQRAQLVAFLKSIDSTTVPVTSNGSPLPTATATATGTATATKTATPTATVSATATASATATPTVTPTPVTEKLVISPK